MSSIRLVEPPSYWYAVQAANEKECSICMEEDGDMIKLSPCFHKYHPACITTWISQPPTPTAGKESTGPSCPSCRESVAARKSKESGRWIPIEAASELVPIPGDNSPLVDRVVRRHLEGSPSSSRHVTDSATSSRHSAATSSSSSSSHSAIPSVQIQPNEYLFYAGIHLFHVLTPQHDPNASSSS